MNNKPIFALFVAIVSAALFAVSCADKSADTGMDNSGEAEFKEIAAKYLDMVTEFEKAKPDIITDPDEVEAKLMEDGVAEEEIKARIDKGETYTDDFPVYVYYESRAEDWREVADALSDFRETYPGSIWADDTLFLSTLLPYMPGRDIETNGYIKQALRVFGTTDIELSIEPWTMERFKDLGSVKTIARDDISLLPPGLKFERKCEALYRFSYAVISIQEGRTDEGKRILGLLKQQYEGSAMAKIATNQLEMLKGEEG